MQILIVDDSELMRTIVEQVIVDNLKEAAQKIKFFHAANGTAFGAHLTHC